MANEAGWTFDTLKRYLDERLRTAEMAAAKTDRMIPRSEYDIQHKALADRIAVNEERLAAIRLELTELSAKATGQRQGVGIIGTVVMSTITVISVIASVITVMFHMK